jgi:hypothetical protein
VQVISTIHDTTLVNIGRKDGKTFLQIKKSYFVVQYNTFMKGVDTADQLLLNSEED